MMRQPACRWGLLLAVMVATGCATTGGGESAELNATDTETENEPESPPEQVRIDPMLVRGGDADAPKTVDSKEVFDRAYEAYSARRYEEALRHYETIIQYFEDSRFYHSSLYNAGLSYEKLERWEAATDLYRQIIDEFPDREDTSDAHYRLAEVYSELGKHEQIVELMTEVMLRDDLTTFDRVEAHTRRSNALLELGNLEEAEQGYQNLIEINDEAPEDERLPKKSRYIVQAYFGLGKIYQTRTSEIPLTLPPESMGEELEKKGDLLLKAQAYYLQALRQHHPHWSVAAGYKIGRLYEDFYSDIFAAEVPDELSDEQVAMYFEELRSKIRPLMERAISVYEKNLSMSRRIGETPENNRWVAQTSESLARIKTYLNNPVTKKQAEKLALEGRDFRTLWESFEMATGEVEKALETARETLESEGEEEGGEVALE